VLRSRRHALVVTGLTGIAIGTATFIAVAMPPAPGAGDWYWPLLIPGYLGFFLVGGVHGGASNLTVAIAMAAANGAIWAFAAGLVIHIARRLVQRDVHSSSPAI